MTAAMADPETVHLEPTCDRCEHGDDVRLWWIEENYAACPHNDCPNKPVQ